MMCPWASRIGDRRSLRPTSDVLTDPHQPFERLHHLSRAAPTLLAAPRTPARGRRLRSEVTETSPPPPKTAPLPVVFFVGRRFPSLIAPVPSSTSILIPSSATSIVIESIPWPHCFPSCPPDLESMNLPPAQFPGGLEATDVARGCRVREGAPALGGRWRLLFIKQAWRMLAPSRHGGFARRFGSASFSSPSGASTLAPAREPSRRLSKTQRRGMRPTGSRGGPSASALHHPRSSTPR